MDRLPARLVLLCLVLAGASVCLVSGRLDASPDRKASGAQYEQWRLELSNLGPWGEDDEIGALNLSTQEKRLEAVALVREGGRR
ncbi:MAG: hypothetical protein OYK82_08185 [Gammaproteobacteria bacterium]|nr:hypothetical protein [Gammaproteobacteria bacterium]